MTGVVVPVLEMIEQHRSSADPVVVTTKRLPVVMDNVAAPIEKALARNGADLTFFLWNTADLVDRWPWAWIFFPHCYPLAGHVRSIRSDSSSMPFTPYGRWPDPSPPGRSPCVGAVMPMAKEILRDAAQRSAMFNSAWHALADRPASSSWVCLSDPLDDEWLNAFRDPTGAKVDA
jgi:hypothetical protein